MVSLVILCVLCIALHSTSATNQVVLTCGSVDQGPVERGPVGPPGKRGTVGSPGREGSRGQKGEPGESDIWRSEFEILQARVSALENQAHIHPTTQPTTSANSTTQPTTSANSTTQPTTSANSTTQPTTCANPTTQTPPQATNCQELLNRGQRSSEIYQIRVNGLSQTIPVYCDQTTDGGGWLVMQRRTDGSEDFYRNWEDYRRGFGNKRNEFWLGLDVIHAITNERLYELRIDMENFENGNTHAKYSIFRIGPLADNYRLAVGGFSGDGGDSLNYHDGQQYSTKDRGSYCAHQYHGAWWYKSCFHSNLNGIFQTSGPNRLWKNYGHSVSLKRVEMKIRPV